MKELLEKKNREQCKLPEFHVPLYNTVHRDWGSIGCISDDLVSEYRVSGGFDDGTYKISMHKGTITCVQRFSVVLSSTYVSPTEEYVNYMDKGHIGKWVLDCLREFDKVSDACEVYVFALGELVPDLIKECQDSNGVFALI